MESVLDQYKLSFRFLEIFGRRYGHATTAVMKNNILAAFLSETKWADDVDTYIQDLNALFSGRTDSDSFDSYSTMVVSNADKTCFIYDHKEGGFANPELIIPTSDFRSVLVEWKAFLLSETKE